MTGVQTCALPISRGQTGQQLLLGKTDLGRQEAHELVRTITMDAEKDKSSFADAIKKNREVKKYLDSKEIDYCLEPLNYTGHSEEIIDKVLGSL